MKTLLVVLMVAAVVPQARAQRLPANATPLHYDLRVQPDLAAATFTGQETIVVTLKAPAAAIVLNAAEITFTAVSIAAAGTTQTARVTLDPQKEQATLTVPDPIPAGEARVHITYRGLLNDDLRGLYLSKANNRRYAVTQLEATDARRMFPSFDEPAFKATFALTAVIDDGDHAISNGAVISDTPGPSPGKHTVVFETTPRMSSYLVALAVGDFVCAEGAADAIPVRICSTPDKKGLTGLALEATREILQYYNRYYAIPYPFKKLDVVAVPDFAAGAMENTAAIFYRETLLLAESDASVRTRRAIAGVLAHEIAHQWFGDLVTMQWWDDLWLNEGFANWMQSKPLKAWKPEWNVELAETAENQTAMRLDELQSTRPIRARATTPNEIGELFDPIAYEKGAAVLRMIESWVGEEPFRKAVNAYLGRYKYGNARAEDFWSTVAASTGKPVDRVMPAFVDQPGVPLVSVATACRTGSATIALSQSRYRVQAEAVAGAAPSQSWRLPVCFHTGGDGGPGCALLEQPAQTVTMPACPAFVMPNAGGRGYYRSFLDAPALAAVTEAVSSLTGPERLTLVSDEWALVRAGKRDIGAFLDLASALGSEQEEPILAALGAILRSIDAHFTTPATRPAFHGWVSRLLGPSAARLGWDTPRDSGDDNARALRALLLRQLGESGDQKAVSEARRLVEQELAAPGTVDATLLRVAVGVAAASGDAALYDRYRSRSESARHPEDRYRFLFGLAGFSDPALAKRTLDYALGPHVRSQDTKSVIAALLANPVTRDAVWDMLRGRWDDVQKKTGAFVGNTIVVSALSSFCDPRRAEEIRGFFETHPAPGAERTLAQTLERINACATLSQAQSSRLAEWLGRR